MFRLKETIHFAIIIYYYPHIYKKMKMKPSDRMLPVSLKLIKEQYNLTCRIYLLKWNLMNVPKVIKVSLGISKK